MGIIETSSGELDAIRDEIAKMKDLTDKPFGDNIAQAFVSDPKAIIDFVIAQGVTFVTTSAGSPTRYTAQLKGAGLTVFHVVPTMWAASKAVEAGVDGLIVEGGEGGGFKNPRPVASMVLLPSVTSAFDVPVIAAGGFLDGPTMAAAFALGAEGVQLGTVMVTATESPVHANWKQAIIDAAETDTVLLNSHASPALRALRTERTNALEFDRERNAMGAFGNIRDVYFGGALEAVIALSGQVAGRITQSRPVADIHRRLRDGLRGHPRSTFEAVRSVMRFARVIDEASVELAVVESVVHTARHLLDTAAATERVAIRCGARLKTAVIIIVVSGAVIGTAVGVKTLLPRRREGSHETVEALVDDALADDIG